MNILSIDTDFRLAMDPNNTMGDSEGEARLWGEHLNQLTIIAFSYRHQYLKVKSVSKNTSVYPTSSSLILKMPFDARKIGRDICRKNPVDLITAKDPFFTGLCGLWLKKEFCLPLNIRLHGNYVNNDLWLQESPINRVFNLVGNYVLNQADSILAVHPEIAKNIQKKIPSLRSDVFTLENDVGIDVDHFSGFDGKNVRKEILPEGMQTLILYAGRLEREKNLDNLLYALKRIMDQEPKTFLLILGQGNEESRLKKRCQDIGLNDHVCFYGTVPYSRMPEYISASDIVVLPSQHEGGGRIIIESLLMKRPVVATNVGLVPGLITDGKNGYVIRSYNSAAIAEALLKAINNSFLHNFDQELFQDLRTNFNRKNIMGDIITAWEKTLK